MFVHCIVVSTHAQDRVADDAKEAMLNNRAPYNAWPSMYGCRGKTCDREGMRVTPERAVSGLQGLTARGETEMLRV